MNVPGRDNRGDERRCEHGDEGLVVDLAELTHRSKQHGERQDEHAGAGRQRAHQLSPDER